MFYIVDFSDGLPFIDEHLASNAGDRQSTHSSKVLIFVYIANIVRKRNNREGTKFGNNRFGRKGTHRCDQCRKRKIKVTNSRSHL